MAKDFAKAFYRSKEWLQCRDAFIKSVFGLCQRCKKPGHIVHHVIPLTPENIGDPNITLNWDNLMYPCLECHNNIHYGSGVLRDDVEFGLDGQLAPRSSQPRLKARIGDISIHCCLNKFNKGGFVG